MSTFRTTLIYKGSTLSSRTLLYRFQFKINNHICYRFRTIPIHFIDGRENYFRDHIYGLIIVDKFIDMSNVKVLKKVLTK